MEYKRLRCCVEALGELYTKEPYMEILEISLVQGEKITSHSLPLVSQFLTLAGNNLAAGNSSNEQSVLWQSSILSDLEKKPKLSF